MILEDDIYHVYRSSHLTLVLHGQLSRVLSTSSGDHRDSGSMVLYLPRRRGSSVNRMRFPATAQGSPRKSSTCRRCCEPRWVCLDVAMRETSHLPRWGVSPLPFGRLLFVTVLSSSPLLGITNNECAGNPRYWCNGIYGSFSELDS